MAYIGKTPVIGNFVKLDSITTVNGQASYTMQNGGVNFTAYANVNQFLVSLNGILQSPTDSFTVSGSTITFASNLVTGDVIDFIIVLGNSLDVGVPSDNTVSTAKLQDSSVSLAKLTATGTKEATTFLRGDNTFAAPSGGLLACYYNQWNTQYTASGTTVTTIFTGDNLTLASTSSKVLFLADLSLGAIVSGSVALQYSTDNGSTYNDITTLDMLDTDNNQLNGKAMIGHFLNPSGASGVGALFMIQDSFSYLHSPNSTQVRYRLVMAASDITYTVSNNRRSSGGWGGISHVTQMEIGV